MQQRSYRVRSSSGPATPASAAGEGWQSNAFAQQQLPSAAGPESSLEQMMSGDSGLSPSYESGEHAELGDAAAGSQVVEIHGVPVSSGQIAALADYFPSVEAIYDCDPAVFAEVIRLLELESAQPGSVSAEQWDALLDGAYSELARSNDAHFSASDPTLLPDSGSDAPSNASTWEEGHRAAVERAQAGDVEAALVEEAFVEHFIQDAFAAGHLFNKADLIAQIEQAAGPVERGQLGRAAGAEVFATDSELIRQYGLVLSEEPFTEQSWSMTTASIALLMPDVFNNGIVKAAHDTLNQHEGGVPVENDAHTWGLSGDGTLNAETEACCAEAIEAAREEVVAAGEAGEAYAVEPGIERVLGLFPRPTEEGTELLQEVLLGAVDQEGGGMLAAVEQSMRELLPDILESLVERKLAHKLDASGDHTEDLEQQGSLLIGAAEASSLFGSREG